MEHHQPEPVQRIRCSPAAPGKVGRIPGYSANLLHRDAPRRNHCRQCRPKARAAAHAAPSALAFFFCAAFPACRISSPARAGCCRRPPRGKAGKYPGSAEHSAWILRPPPAPGRISTASAAPMTPQPTSCTACTPCQTSQQPAAHRQHLPTPHPASPAAHLPQQITPPTAKNHTPQPAAGGVRFFT